MTIIETVWMVTLGVAVVLAVVDMFVGWLVDGNTGQRAVWAIVLQWIALFSQALVVALVLESGG